MYDISQNKDQHIMKPSKLNIQSEILCQIFYGLANFWQRSNLRSAEEQTLYVHKGCLTLKQQVLVFFFGKCLPFNLFKTSVNWLLTISYSWIKRYHLIGQLWNHLYAEICMCLIVLFVIRSKPLFIQNIWIDHTNIQQSEEYLLPPLQYASGKVWIF